MEFSHRYGHKGGSYPRIMEACRHYWNTCLPLAASALDRELLQHPLSELLSLVVSLSGGRRKKERKVGFPLVGGGERREEGVAFLHEQRRKIQHSA